MTPKDKPSDECITNVAIQTLHKSMAKSGIQKPMNDLAERESPLAAYVLFSSHQISETVRISGAPPTLVHWVNEEVQARMLVCLEAQDQAHYQLWREFMGDYAPENTPDKSNPNQKEDDHGR